MKAVGKPTRILIAAMLLPALLWCCSDTGKKQFTVSQPAFSSYRDIPGITSEEIAAIEALRQQTDYFIYGMPLSTETFENEKGEISGFTAVTCKWLTELFGIPFRPELYEWNDLIENLATGKVSFSGELTPTEERRKIYHMTGAIASRPVKAFRIAGSRPLWEIAEARPLRCGFMKGAATIKAVTSEMRPGTFEIVEIEDFNYAYDALKNGEFDAFYYSGVAEVNFIKHTDVVAHDFFPLIYMPVSLSTRTPALEPIISVVDKALRNNGLQYLTTLYNRSHKEYLKFKLYSQLTEEERAYIAGKPVIPVGIDPGNYPGCFYDRREKEWRGISLDILDEIAALTEITFKRANDEYTEWPIIYQMLVDGKVLLLPELTQMAEREGMFLWPENVQMVDHYALISNIDYPDIKPNEILHVKVGVAINTAYATIFKKWFPNHMNTFEYESVEDAFSALQRGEVDMVMANQKRLLYLTHYLESPNYKANIVFDYAINIKFGINKDEAILCSIIDKALGNIDTRSISDYWMRKTYDYRSKIAEARTPWIIGAAISSILVLILVVAITKRREAVQRMTMARDAAEMANQTKSMFLANMSHEIRTPMNAILGITEILIQDDKLPGGIEEGLDKIYSSCDLLMGIINDILDFSKIEAGKLDIMPIPYKVASLVNDSVHLNMMRINSKPIEFELQIDENIPAKLIGDELRIKQILNNLLSNAFKYTDAGKVTLAIETVQEPQGPTLVMSVRDTGHGMTKEQLDKMFEEYSRFNQGKNVAIEGTGLGLAITQRLINFMHGSMYAESEPGKGTFFTVRLPQGEAGDDEILGKDVAENLRKFRVNYMAHKKRGRIVRDLMPYGSVLIVDDVETNIYVAAGLMKLYRLQTDTAMSGYEAIDKIKSGRKYDIVFMDHMMPEIDGIETTKRLRDLGYTSPIVALTANAVAGQVDIFLQNGFDEFISKPIDIRQLNSILNKLIRDKQPPEVIEAAKRAACAEINDNNCAMTQIDPLLMESFIRDLLKVVSTLEELGKKDGWHENADDLHRFTVMVHGIKSSLRNMGETELSDLAYKLENAGRERNIETITAFTTDFSKELNELLEKIEQKPNENDGSGANGADEDIEDLCSKLTEIREACTDYNRKGALDILTGIKNRSKETKAVLDKIMTHLLHSEFDKAESAAVALSAELSPTNRKNAASAPEEDV